MGTIIVPKFLKRPEVCELPGVPELFCDVALMHDHGDTVRILLCREREVGSQIVDLSAYVFMPRGGFCRTLGWAANDFLTFRRVAN